METQTHIKTNSKRRRNDNKSKLFGTAPPTIFGHPLSTIAEEGETAVFMCQFRGAEVPLSQIRWMKNRQPIHVLPGTNLETLHHYQNQNPMTLAVGSPHQQQQRQQRFTSYPENGTLKIDSVQMTDGGDYTCEIITPGHPPVESRPAQLFVTGIYDEMK